MPRLWAVAKKHNFVTAADFVEGRFQSKPLALAVAFTGILATMPYIALQLVGLQAVLQAMGLSGSTGTDLGSRISNDLPLIVAFLILALYTFSSGLRAPALVAIVKDVLVYGTVLALVILVPIKLGGFGNIFAHIKPASLTLASDASKLNSMWAFATLAFGSAFALFLYPHSLTSTFSSKSGRVIQRNAVLLPLYSVMLALLAFTGFMALAAPLGLKPTQGIQAVPALINYIFPDWFKGIAFAAIGIGALVPAAVMSIAAANLFTRNIYKPFFRPNASEKEEVNSAKITSLVVKFGALVVVLLIPVAQAINLQLLGGMWILQTLPPVIFALYTRWFNRWALLIGWAAGMAYGTYIMLQPLFNPNIGKVTSTVPVTIAGSTLNGYAALYAVVLNIVVATVLSLVFNLARVPNGKDITSPADYKETDSTTTVEAPSAVALAEE
jgi:SSS family solute:Na+ symporter